MEYLIHISSRIRQTGRYLLHKLERWLIPTLSYAFIFLFVYTGSDKLAHLERFSRGIMKIPYIGGLVPIIGPGIPLLEIGIALLLIWPRSKRLGLQLATGLMVLFTLYLGLMLLFVKNRLCHCGGVIESLGWGQHIVFNLIFVLLGSWALHLYPNNNKTQNTIK